MIRNLRRTSQGLFLLIFLFLFIQTESKGADELGYPVRIFLECDPLLALSTFLSSHRIANGFLLSVILVVVTIALGRVFCGWICPFGTLHTMTGTLKKPSKKRSHTNWHKIKYYILFFVLSSSVFTAQLSGIVDPLSLLIRSLTLGIYPAVNYLTRALFDTVYATGIPGIVEVSEFFFTLAKKSILSFHQTYYVQAAGIGLLFIILLSLNFYERRFWCKYLCPLGAFLGILSRFAVLKRSVSEGCTSCGVCERICTGGAVVDESGTWKISECLYCMDCDDLCPHRAIRFGFTTNMGAVPMNLERRHLIASVFAGALAVPLLRIPPLSRTGVFTPTLIRPPGALEEREFITRCIRCGECMKVCITNGLQPTLFEAGLEGVWSPVLVPTIGYCEYHCTLCGQVCPTGAIQKLTLPQKETTKIGVAIIDTSRCLTYAYATPCIVCEEVCPTPEKAIWFERVKTTDREGNTIVMKQPHVDLHRCIGCGTCETHCPVKSKPAIYVISTGETRSQDNRALFS